MLAHGVVCDRLKQRMGWLVLPDGPALCVLPQDTPRLQDCCQCHRDRWSSYPRGTGEVQTILG